MKLLLPRLYVDSLLEITPEFLQHKGIKALILDLDNTLIACGEEKADPRVVAWLNRLREAGFKLCIVSNNTQEKGEELARCLGIPGVFRAVKPRGKSFRKALALLGTSPRETAMVGDQLFTDVLGGNRMGLYTILVPPLGGPDFILTRLITRRIERLFLPFIRARYRLVSRESGG